MTVKWIEAIEYDAVPEGDCTGVSVGGKAIAMARVEGQVYAISNLCTHGNARLCDGFLEGHEIECPLHQGKFDIRDGRALTVPLTEDAVVYPVKVEAGRVYIGIMP